MATFVAEVISDSPAYGNASSAIQNVASAFLGGGKIPVGTIEWAAASDPTFPAATGYAAPLLPWSTSIPVVGEFVLLISSPSPGQTTEDSSQESFYYLGPIGLDGNKNINAHPGFMKRSTSPVPTLPPTYKFSEKRFPPLQPLQGDTIFQDRNGSVIRMSSTQKGSALGDLLPSTGPEPVWTDTKDDPEKSGTSFQSDKAGNPIMTISVGLPGDTSGPVSIGAFTGTTTIYENLTKKEGDRSSIILTSDQKIKFNHQRKGWKTKKQMFQSNKSYVITGANKSARGAKAYPAAGIAKHTYLNPLAGSAFQGVDEYPKSANQAHKSQIILASDRVVIDSRSDGVLINGFNDVKIGTKNWRMETDATMNCLQEMLQQTIILTQHVQEVGKQLDDTLELIKILQFPTGVGPTGPCLDVYFRQAKGIQAELTEVRNDAKTRSDQFVSLYKEFQKQERKTKDQGETF
jgi:hypothetical protein